MPRPSSVEAWLKAIELTSRIEVAQPGVPARLTDWRLLSSGSGCARTNQGGRMQFQRLPELHILKGEVFHVGKIANFLDH